MTSFTISDNDLDQIKDQVAVITGIGLATLRRIIKHGGKVYAGDLNPLPEPEAGSVPFSKVDVTDWREQLELFKAAEKKYGKIDHVFANAGIAPTISLLEEDVDSSGDLLPPNLKTINVNLLGCLYTVKLGIHHIRRNPSGGSIVITASGSSFTRFPATDYTTTKHAVLGLMRSLTGHLYPQLPIRINAIAPSWTETGILSPAILAAIGEGNYQSADVPAQSVTVLMADKKRHGELVYSERGHFKDLENGEKGYHHLTANMLAVENEESLSELKVMRNLLKMRGAGEVGDGADGKPEVV
ncbi:NAD(P)-binding protein [Macroventuria anomochaeta]|uniref:NAD(P)-binding protein n=1 Tax=Macroventuria anomochaeta TaxID=301207 RepID=A0ACB6S544_9PLEO|nr:NAD(P)-binding protein [Macroventuria anomochaeta]KAF2629163.1 NAD(P)-binding protein [Macroventuria anomochaeta]